MTLLLDTQLLLWLAAEPMRIPPAARALFEQPGNEFAFSAASVTNAHAVAVRFLPLLYKDPFDRILLAQAIVEGFSLVTTDLQLRQYNAPIYPV